MSLFSYIHCLYYLIFKFKAKYDVNKLTNNLTCKSLARHICLLQKINVASKLMRVAGGIVKK